MKTMNDEDVYKLIRAVRRNWSSSNYDFDRGIRSLGLALCRCSDEVVDVVRATIDEASRRQLYALTKQ